MKYEFTIFGSGISAKITASLLLRKGFKVCLIKDNISEDNVSSTNLVTFLSSGSLHYLSSSISNSNIFEKYPGIQAINCQLDSLSGNKSQSIRFKDNKYETLGKIIKNIDLEKFLDSDIKQFNNLDIINFTTPPKIENTANGVKIMFQNGDCLYSDLFILSSLQKNITRQLKVQFTKRDFEQQALSISIKGNIKNKHCAFQKFTSDGPIAFLPYSDEEASIVWSLKNNSKVLLKSNKELNEIISINISEQIDLFEIKSIDKHQLRFVYAKNLFYKNTVLIGNIAHNIHPIAGQGLNLSIKDIALFVRLMSKYTSLGYKVNNKLILEKFETERKLDNSSYSFGTFSLNSIFSSDNKYVNYTTRKALSLIEKNKYIKQMFVRSATGKDFFKTL